MYFSSSPVILPYQACSIGEDAFRDCKRLTSVTIPGSVKYLLDRSFNSCKNLEITIPDTVLSIGESALVGVKKVRCIEGSAAYQYAINNFIDFEIISKNDINNDINDNPFSSEIINNSTIHSDNSTAYIVIIVLLVFVIIVLSVLLWKKTRIKY